MPEELFNKLRSSARLEHDFKEVNTQFNGVHKSTPIVIRNLPWTINLEIKMINGVKHVNFFVGCDYEDAENWSCATEWRLTIINKENQGKSKIKTKRVVFSSKYPSYYFWPVFVKFNWLTNQKNGLIKEDSIKVILELKAKMPRNCNFTKEVFYEFLDKEREKSLKIAEENVKIHKEYQELKMAYEKLKKDVKKKEVLKATSGNVVKIGESEKIVLLARQLSLEDL
jgi:hypothetical protein